MGNIFDMVKQATAMQRQMKQVQKELERETVEHASGGGMVKVTARGDMTVKQVKIDPSLLDPARVAKLEDLIAAGVNGALEAAKKQAGERMSKLAGGGGLSGLADMLKG